MGSNMYEPPDAASEPHPADDQEWPRTDRPRLRVVLADDHTTVREGLRLLFEATSDIEIVADVADGQAALEAVHRLRPDVIVLDLSMPGTSGLVTARAIHQEAPGVAIVVLTRHAEQAFVQELRAAGASAYVLKQSAFGELLSAVRTVAAGGRYLDQSLEEPTPRPRYTAPGREPGNTAVTDRELSVLRLATQGRSNKDIATQLNIAVKTVEVHKASAMRKLQLRDRADAVRYAVMKGWLQDP